MTDSDKPEVVAYRLHALEAKVDTLSTKFDALTVLVQKNLCPQPGACLQIVETVRRLEEIMREHETQLQDLRMKAAQAQASLKTFVAMASAGGTVAGTLIGLLVQWFSKGTS